MKPNDEALDEALSVTQIPEENMREYMRRVLTAAFAAQLKSEDYAGLVEELRQECRDWLTADCVAKAADAIEALLAKLNNKPKPSEDYAGLVKDLRAFDEELLNAQPHSCEQTAKQAADALEAVLADRDALMAVNAEFSVVFKERDDAIAERDALKAERAAGHMWIQMRATVLEELAMVRAERDALAARLAPVEDEALVEICAKGIASSKTNGYEAWMQESRDAIAAIRPHIEAVERGRCAKIAEGSFLFDIETWLNSTKKEMTAHVAKAIAAAIRSGK